MPSEGHSRSTGAVPTAPMWDIRDILAIFRRRWIWLLLPALLLTTAAIATMLSIPARYDAKATLLIDPRGMQVVDRTLEPTRNSGEESLALVESQVRVLTSEATLQKVIDQLGLVDDAEFGRPPPGLIGNLRGAIAALLGSPQRTSDVRLATLERLQKAVKAERATGSYIVDLYVRSEDPDKAARLANAIADLFITEDRGVRSRASGRVGAELGTQLEGLKRQVQEAEQKVEAFKTTNGLVSARGNLVSEQQLSEVANQLIVARLKTSEAQSRVDQIGDALKAGGALDAIGDPVQSPTISALRVRLAAARQSEAALLASLRPAHPSVQAAQASIQSITAQIRSELTRIASTARAELARARSTEAQVAASEAKLRREAERTSGATVALRELERDRDSLRKVYEGFLVRVRELGGQKSVDTSNSRVYSRATPPQRRSGPSFAVLIAGALAAGLVLGALLALLAEQLATTRRPKAMHGDSAMAPRRQPRVWSDPAADGSAAATDAAAAAERGHAPSILPAQPFPARRPHSVRSSPDADLASGVRPEPREPTPGYERRPVGADDSIVTVIERTPRVPLTIAPRSTATRTSAATRQARAAAQVGRFQPPGEQLLPARRTAAMPHRTAKVDAPATRVTMLGVVDNTSFQSGVVRDIVYAEPTSEDADAFFSAAYQLSDAARAQSARVILITATQGAQTSALGAFNLALASASAGERVLLIDADLASRRLSRTLVPGALRGLVDVAEGSLPLGDVTWHDPDTFDLVPASGIMRRSPSALRLAETIGTAASSGDAYSRIIIDAGALANDPAAAGLLAGIADAIVLMTPLGVGTPDKPVAMPAALDGHAGKVAGAIAVIDR